MSHKQDLQKIIDDLKTKKFRDGEAKGLMSSIQQEQTAALRPVLESMAKTMAEKMAEHFTAGIGNVKIDVPKSEPTQVSVNVPDIHIPDIRVPEPRVTVNVPDIKIPEIKVPEQKVSFPSVFKIDNDRTNPLPVILTDSKNRTYSIEQFVTGGGGKVNKQYQEADTASLITGIPAMAEQADVLYPLQLGLGVADRALRVVQAADSSSSVNISLSNALDVIQVSGSVDSVNILQVAGTAVAAGEGIANAGTLRIVQAVDSISSVNITNTTVAISAGATLETIQVSGSVDSINVLQLGGTAIAVNTGVANDGTLRTVQAADSVSSVSFSLSSALDVVQVSGSVDSVNVLQIGGTAVAVDQGVSNAGTLRVVQALDSVSSVVVNSFVTSIEVKQVSGSSDSVSASIDAQTISLGVLQASGSVDSINILQVGGTAVAVDQGVSNAGTLRVVQALDAVSSVNIVNANALDVIQVSGSVASINILQVAGTAIAVGEGVSNDGTLRIVQAVDSASSVRAISNSGVDIGDVDVLTLPAITVAANEQIRVLQLSGSSDSVNVVTISGSAGSVAVSGTVASDVADDGNPPVKIGGIARTANPTAVAANDVVSATFDDLGRMVIVPHQVRDLVTTAYLSLANGTETSLLAGAASTFHDLVYIMAANQSDAAVDIDFRSGTAGSVVFSVTVPADATAGVAPPVPIPQTEVAQAWTADMADITGTTVTISALFIKNV